MLDICSGIRQRKLKIKWDIRAHVNTIDAEMLCELKKSGCELICYGIESGNNEILKRMKKGITKEKAAEVIGLTKKAGIRTLAYFMLGFPAETREQMRETIDFSKKLDPDFCHYAILVPFPCTAVYEEGLARGIFKKDFWREFAANPTAHFKPPVWVEKVPEHEMRELLEKAYKEFYFRPVYLMRRLLAVRSWGDFLRKTQTGLRLFHQQGAK